MTRKQEALAQRVVVQFKTLCTRFMADDAISIRTFRDDCQQLWALSDGKGISPRVQQLLGPWRMPRTEGKAS